MKRVVTGVDAEGKSCILFDGPVPRHSPVANLVWRTPSIPADNSRGEDMAVPYAMEFLHDGGSNFILTELPPGGEAAMHATDTVDYLAVLSGEVVLALETGEVALKPGDLVVDRGVMHGWRNDGTESAVFVSVTLPAGPVGRGRTV